MSKVDYSSFNNLDQAIRHFRDGKLILIHDSDDREGETDMVLAAASVTPADITRLRNDAGGLICVALSAQVAETFRLPYLEYALDHPICGHVPSYDSRSAFSLTINHVNTSTGISDTDRALTISKLGCLTDEPTLSEFSASFYSPGHVQLLKAATGLISDRRGHTELSMVMARLAEREPATVVCEMLDDGTKQSLPKTEAKEYANRNGVPFVDGKLISNRFRQEDE